MRTVRLRSTLNSAFCERAKALTASSPVSSMTRLHFVGYNGYHQIPTVEAHPKVITKWTCGFADGNLRECTHRFLLFETEKFFKTQGVVTVNCKTENVFEKPAKTDAVGSNDEFLLASDGTNVWKYSYSSNKWMKIEFSFKCEKEKSVWEETGNKVLKFAFLHSSDVVLLLSNGSVWVLSSINSLKIVYPYDIDKAVDISSGFEHSLILTESGCVLSFGNENVSDMKEQQYLVCYSRGQLGHGDLDPTHQSVQIAVLEGLKVTKIASGGWHSCAVTDSGDLYTWGWNNFGQLSAFEDEKEIGLSAIPILVDVGDEPEMKVMDVACGTRHTACKLGMKRHNSGSQSELLDNGDFYLSGWNKYGQLGIETNCEKVSKFTKCAIQKGQNCKIFCGPWYTVLVEE